MKKVSTIVFGLVIAASSALYAEENTATENQIKKMFYSEPPTTLLNWGETHFSGYGGPALKVTALGNTITPLMGGKGGLIINDSFVIGGGGFGAVRDFKKNINSQLQNVQFGYGGLLLEYHLFPKQLFHISMGLLSGAGAITYWPEGMTFSNNNEPNLPADKFLVLEPDINLYVNIARFCRLGIGGSYRYINGLNTQGFTDKAYSRFAGSIMLEFGWF